MDFKQLISDQIDQYISEKLPEQTGKHLEKMVDSVLGDLFSTYGENSKEIKRILSEKIRLDLTKLSLIDYNGMIATAIQNHFNDLAMKNSVEPIMKLIGDVVGEKLPYEEISLDTLFEKVKEYTIDGLEHGDEGEVSFFATYNKKYDWIECWADADADTSQGSCGIKFIFSWVKATKEKWGGTIFSMVFPTYKGMESTIVEITRLDKIEKYIHKLYMSGVRISVPLDLEDGDIDFEREFEVDLS